MPRSDLVHVFARDLEPGRRVRLSCAKGLVSVVDVTEDDELCVINTDRGAYVCGPLDLIDAEDSDSEVMAP